MCCREYGETVDLLLTNCSKCRRLIVRSIAGSICKQCFFEHVDDDGSESADETDVSSSRVQHDHACESCGAAVETDHPYCVRCRLKLVRRNREAVAHLSKKLAQFPSLRGTERSTAVSAGFHTRNVRMAGIRSGRKARSERQFTPPTKYAT